MVSSATIFYFTVVLACLSPGRAEFGSELEEFIRTVGQLQQSVGHMNNELTESLKGIPEGKVGCWLANCGEMVGMALLDPLLYISEPVLYIGSAVTQFLVAIGEFTECIGRDIYNITYCGNDLVGHIKQDFRFIKDFFPVYNNIMNTYNAQIVNASKTCFLKTDTCDIIKPKFPPIFF